jgi:hypothetical protein
MAFHGHMRVSIGLEYERQKNINFIHAQIGPAAIKPPDFIEHEQVFGPTQVPPLMQGGSQSAVH